ncbi:MAG TPA: radical SAM protein [Gemmatimonadales bacterium]|nr:radical SAM protein [Gemmatimonadales bacterium]
MTTTTKPRRSGSPPRPTPRSQLPLLASEPHGGEAGARLPVLDQRQRGATFLEVPVKAILNSPATTGMGFWSLNPYVGCEFGCTYCYARETHKWVAERHQVGGAAGAEPDMPAWEAFERRILVKTTAAAVLQRTLFPAKLEGCSLVIGTATDPYQPAERRFRLTRSLLEALLGWRGLSLGIITKSPLVLRDLDLLKRLSERHELTVNISLASVDAALLRRIEARSPAPHARLRALKGLTSAGIHAGLLVAPILPGITDSREALAAIMAAGKAAGARYVAGFPLRLGPAARTRFLPHLAEQFPELVERYHHRFGHSQSAGKDYTEALKRRIRSLQQAYGFPVDSGMSRREREGRAPRQQAIPEVVEQWKLL